MNKKVLTIILCAALIILLIAASLWYNKLSDSYEAENSGTAPEGEAVMAPDFTSYDMDGNAVKLSEKFGKPIVINFWASWCGPCKAELPSFEAMYNKYGDEVEFMMVNLTGGRETKETVLDFLEISGHEFPVYLDMDQEAAVAYGLNSIPRTVFINSDGTVYAGHIGVISENILKDYIEKITE